MKYEKVLSQTFTDNFQTALLNKNINKMKKLLSELVRDWFNCLRLESSGGIRICFTLESDF